MKKSKDILGDVLRAIIILAIIASAVGAIYQFNSGDTPSAIMYIGSILGCLFLYWLILTISKIAVDLKELNNNFSDFFYLQRDFFKAYYNQTLNKDNAPKSISHEDMKSQMENDTVQ